MKQKVIYYQDMLSDDFAHTHIKTQPLRASYRYIRTNPLWRLCACLIYRVLAQPLVFLIVKIGYRQRFANRQVLEKVRHSGAYVYANHTNMFLDAFLPNLLRRRRRGYILVGPDTMSIPGIRNLVQMLGAIPLGTTMQQKKEMLRCVRTRVRQGNLVTIYPEAHIWPYYTGIRPFPADAFGYPDGEDVPVIAMTNCYQKRTFGSRPRVVTYFDGPFYPDKGLPPGKRREALRRQCYEAMTARAGANSTYSYILYKEQE